MSLAVPSVSVEPRGGLAFRTSLRPNQTASRFRYKTYRTMSGRVGGRGWSGVAFLGAPIRCAGSTSTRSSLTLVIFARSRASWTVFSSFASGTPVKLRQFLREYCSRSASRALSLLANDDQGHIQEVAIPGDLFTFCADCCVTSLGVRPRVGRAGPGSQ